MKTYKVLTLRKLVGLTYKKAYYWTQTGILRSSAEGDFVYSLMEVAIAIIVSQLRTVTSIQKIRPLIDSLRPLLKEELLSNTRVLFLPPTEFFVIHSAISKTATASKVSIVDVGAALRPLLQE